MISNFLRSLLSEESDPVSTDDAQIALAVLMVAQTLGLLPVLGTLGWLLMLLHWSQLLLQLRYS